MRKLLLLTLAIPLGAWILPSAAGAPQAPNAVTLSTRLPASAIAADGKRAALLMPGRGHWRIVIWGRESPGTTGGVGSRGHSPPRDLHTDGKRPATPAMTWSAQVPSMDGPKHPAQTPGDQEKQSKTGARRRYWL